ESRLSSRIFGFGVPVLQRQSEFFGALRSLFQPGKQTTSLWSALRRDLHGLRPDSPSTHAVSVALGVNVTLCTAKFLVASWTGSAALKSEGWHSLADCFNQALQLFGIRRSRRAPDWRHQFGYGNERYIASLTAACFLFFVG
ncbi:MAG: hypothetical protein MHM6MM_009635, partial [Cercozoa sp. M6MM]